MRDGLSPNGTTGTGSGSTGTALSTLFHPRQLSDFWRDIQLSKLIERQLEKERDQLPLWVPVALGFGIACWFNLATGARWLAFISLCGGIVLFAVTSGGTRLGKVLFWFALLAGIGCALIWLRSWSVAAPVLERPIVTTFNAEIERVEPVLARDMVRLTLSTGDNSGLPPRVRVNVPLDRTSPGLQDGALIQLRARLMPPAMPALPGAYDFSERAWFQGLGATGQALGEIRILRAADPVFALSRYRQMLSAHVQSQMAGAAGAIGATLATGDRGAIDEEDAEAMRRSGLAHLLSISGLHVTAVVGAVYLLILKTLALSPALALRFRLPIVAAAGAALAAVAYTLMTGAQVPTIRACVAALLVLVALMMGRSAITLRMVAAGALFVLIFWPESLVGPSFQLSFAAVTAIIALHEHPRIKALLMLREESLMRRAGRFVFALFLTGLVVEIALMPIALYHFHKAGLYGALANIIAIPLTTFLIMPLEALALVLDGFGLGAPVWWLCEQALSSLIALAHFVSSRPGAVTMLPTMPVIAFGLVLLGGLWLCLWREPWRYWGLGPMLVGGLVIATTRAPDLYITGDGRHVAIRNEQGELAMLRNRSGDFIRDMVRENAGVEGEPQALEDWPNATCNGDSCLATVSAGGRDWQILATRSGHYIPALALSAACRRADIVVSERRLPDGCQPRWLKADRNLLSQVGGMTIDLENRQISTALGWTGRHIWTRYRVAARGNAASARPDQ
ncbi:ComEC/Rec2 family competence protein [Sphingorhabdus sp. 109]|jgi:competence protein ComEC|uniref:ComEC/Rec2 family competence protein n=1 Tax=Sphingorhabdus sp. 109 TaxID=2653173 RepID=UPI0012F413E2|nr:ComEC/Rec2 family competence protein [Sphingorhabdus sp. 109]VWX56783.1 ComE operon protein 3 [Sphingorhabdus sp. 109]